MNKISRIKENIFPGARGAIYDWEKFKWHKGAYQKHSSQALAIDFFGTLKTSTDRNLILNRLAREFNMPSSKKWEVELEWCDKENLLNEKRTKTQVDAIAISEHSLIFFECKFTEGDGGSCSQPGKGECNGKYEYQINPKNKVLSKCSLSGKCMKYWEVIPHLFKLDPTKDYDPCRFSGSWYQWMRNIVVCNEVAKRRHLIPRFRIIYADAPGLPMTEKNNKDELNDLSVKLKTDKQFFGWNSYQELLKLSIESCVQDKDIFIQLERWMLNKIIKIYL